MSNLRCPCGAVISDTTDDLPYKAHFVTDLDLEPLFDRVGSFARTFAASALAGGESDLAATLVDQTLGRTLASSRTLYECEACGRLAVDIGGNQFAFYSPDSGVPNRPFRGLTS